jgi:hypothetical protein
MAGDQERAPRPVRHDADRRASRPRPLASTSRAVAALATAWMQLDGSRRRREEAA